MRGNVKCSEASDMVGIGFDDIAQKLSYNPETGVLLWKDDGYANIRGEAGFIWEQGRTKYRQVSIFGRRLYAHRIAWLLYGGEWPGGDIDHINGNGLDNRIRNLRVVSRSDNIRNCRLSKNNKSGVNGVFWCRQNNKWRAVIKYKRKNYYLGFFTDICDAKKARKKAERDFGFHPNHGEER